MPPRSERTDSKDAEAAYTNQQTEVDIRKRKVTMDKAKANHVGVSNFGSMVSINLNDNTPIISFDHFGLSILNSSP